MPKTVNSHLDQKNNLDIHNYDKRISSCSRRIEKALSEANVDIIKKYHRAMKLETIAKATQLKHLEIMLNLSRFLKKDWKQASLDELKSHIWLKEHPGQYLDDKQTFSKISEDHESIIRDLRADLVKPD